MNRWVLHAIRIGKRLACAGLLLVACAGYCLAGDAAGSPGTDRFRLLLQRTGDQMSEYVEKFSDVRCIEKVVQEKFKNDGNDKVDLKEESTYDYLVILSNNGGELSLSESRLPVREAKADRKNRSMLVSNGFATLFLMFHPLYANSFEFSELEKKWSMASGRPRSSSGIFTARALRPHLHCAAGSIRWSFPAPRGLTRRLQPRRISAGIDNTLADVGLNTLQTEVEFAPFSFHDPEKTYWFPPRAVVEVETPRQHWRNTHEFTNYKRFSVSTEEQVATK